MGYFGFFGFFLVIWLILGYVFFFFASYCFHSVFQILPNNHQLHDHEGEESSTAEIDYNRINGFYTCTVIFYGSAYRHTECKFHTFSIKPLSFST